MRTRRFQRGIECIGRVTEAGSHRWTKGLVATVGSLLSNITSIGLVSARQQTEIEVLGLSEIASKASDVSKVWHCNGWLKNNRGASNRRRRNGLGRQ